MKKLFFAFVTALALFTFLPGRADAQSGIYNWTGFYAGVHLGGAWEKTKGTDNFFDPYPPDITSQSLSGTFGGLQFGYNQQFGRIVWGTELSGSYGSIIGKGNCFPQSIYFLFPGEEANCRSKQDWGLELLTKLGYAMGDGRLLPYVTGGIVLSKLGIKRSDDDGFGDVSTWGTREFQFGAGLGAGIQYALGDGISIGVEYLYVQYFSQNYLSTITATCGCPPGLDFASQNLSSQTVRVVLNYTFGSPAPTVETKTKPVGASSGAYDWTGLYIGGHAGTEWAKSKGTVTDILSLIPIPVVLSNSSQGFGGALAGLQFGLNYQIGRAVFGAELSGSWKNADSTGTCFDSSFTGLDASCRIKQDWSTMFLGKFGYVLGDGAWLPYVIGGVAVSKMNIHYSLSTSGITFFDWGADKTMVGGVIGAGIQYAYGNGFSLGIEYLYTRYGTQDFSSINASAIPFLFSFTNNSANLTDQSLRLVANYKFGDSIVPNEHAVRVYDWTGMYFGVSVGREWAKATGSDSAVFANSPILLVTDLTNQKFQQNVFGGQIGYNLQAGRTVFGTEFSASYNPGGGTANCFQLVNQIASFGLPLSGNCKTRDNWTARQLGRIGYAFDDGRLLPYVLGGVALTQVKEGRSFIDGFAFFPDTLVASWGDSKVHVGAVIGAGFQYALQNNYSIGIEYLYTWYGMQQYSSPGATNDPFAPVFPASFAQDLKTQTLRFTLNYKFDGGL